MKKSNLTSLLRRIVSFLIRWAAFTGLLSSNTACPFCGQPGCPVGIGAAGLLGIVFTLITGKKLLLRSGKSNADKIESGSGEYPDPQDKN